jgi:flagellar protein FlgJ
MPISPLSPQPPMPAPAPGKAPDADLAMMRRKAEELESAFLSVMLGHAGVGRPLAEMGGGSGEAQFASLLRDAQAEAIVARGGIGLADTIFEALVRRSENG